MKPPLVLGNSGQDGGSLAQALLAEGCAVHGTTRDHRAASFAGLERLGIRERITLSSLEPADFAATKAFLERTPVDEIYNLSGQSSVATSFVDPRGTFESIATATLNVLECLRLLRTPARYYSAGSSEMFGDTPKPADEATPPRPLSPYGLAKAAAHHAVTHYREVHGLFATTGILFNHESPLRPAHFVTQKIVSTAVRIAGGSDERLTLGSVDIRRDWGWAPDYVDAMRRILRHGAPDDFVIGTGRSHTLREFVERAFTLAGLAARDHVDFDPGLLRPADIMSSESDPAKAERVLGWRATRDLDGVIRGLIAG
ncbi:MAG: GDP-mannose 4,6-dehydratase [Planctomycetia bacterium]